MDDPRPMRTLTTLDGGITIAVPWPPTDAELEAARDHVETWRMWGTLDAAEIARRQQALKALVQDDVRAPVVWADAPPAVEEDR